MKCNMAAVLFFGGLLVASGAISMTSARVQSPAGTQNRTPVVVELFTSEGCSTCPPADELLLNLEERQFIDGAEVIAIEEHVDYWNHDGWTDPFSSSEWTLRQQDYAAALKIGGVYTPQMVIDGREQFIGSRINEVSASILKNAHRQRAAVGISEIATTGKQAKQFQVTVTDLVDPPQGDACEVWLLITEKGLHSQVNAGENAGKKLRHASIVRWMHRVGAVDGKRSTSLFSGEGAVKLKSAWNVENLRVVAFVQARRSKEILGASSLALSR